MASIEKRLGDLEAATEPERPPLFLYVLDGMYYDGDPYTTGRMIDPAELADMQKSHQVITLEYTDLETEE